VDGFASMQRWADSGAMAITGLPDRPLGPPEGLVDELDALGRRFGLDGVALLGERAALMGLWRRGATSCGGSCRLLPTQSGWLAVSLPRAEDVDAVPAWLELDGALPATAPAVWSAVARGVATAEDDDADDLVARAALFGLPVARVGELVADGDGGVTRQPLGAAPSTSPEGLLVVDLSSLWAGPLCGDLLAGAGARVVKVESVARPDGARRGPPAFFDLLNGRKRSVALDFTSRSGAALLRQLVEKADVVIEASRPRALEQLGIGAVDVVQGGSDGPQVWVSITGYGRTAASASASAGIGRVAFGDDAAAAGGLVVWDQGAPLFCADAVADPVTGLTAAASCLDALAAGGRWLLDVSMAAVCARLAGPTLAVHDDLRRTVSEPQARPAPAAAPALGADTTDVLAELGLDV
jgi:crotonobetainyl-CoA:carnitine CoA-transferase CaiB-like acyl-CoA transferase